MNVQLDHTTVRSHDRLASAEFLARVLGIDEPTDFGDRSRIELSDGVCLDYQNTPEFLPQHYALLISETDFDDVVGRMQKGGIEYFGGGGRRRPQEIGSRDGSPTIYFLDPDENSWELVTCHMVPTSPSAR